MRVIPAISNVARERTTQLRDGFSIEETGIWGSQALYKNGEFVSHLDFDRNESIDAFIGAMSEGEGYCGAQAEIKKVATVIVPEGAFQNIDVVKPGQVLVVPRQVIVTETALQCAEAIEDECLLANGEGINVTQAAQMIEAYAASREPSDE